MDNGNRKRVLASAAIFFPIALLISYSLTTIHSHSFTLIIAEALILELLCIAVHFAMLKLPRNVMGWLVSSVILVALSVPAFWVTAMSFGWSDDQFPFLYSGFLFPIWMAIPAFVETINSWISERGKR